ncbi:MAG TPA: hypothetical protein PKD00_11210 [Burkholderiales bacterium]|nr:hypothetical protein [Burkholderiales bacterium]
MKIEKIIHTPATIFEWGKSTALTNKQALYKKNDIEYAITSLLPEREIIEFEKIPNTNIAWCPINKDYFEISKIGVHWKNIFNLNINEFEHGVQYVFKNVIESIDAYQHGIDKINFDGSTESKEFLRAAFRLTLILNTHSFGIDGLTGKIWEAADEKIKDYRLLISIEPVKSNDPLYLGTLDSLIKTDKLPQYATIIIGDKKPAYLIDLLNILNNTTPKNTPLTYNDFKYNWKYIIV